MADSVPHPAPSARSLPPPQVLENPELASGFANPKVQAAIFDISQNPMNVMKYQEDPEVSQGAEVYPSTTRDLV